MRTKGEIREVSKACGSQPLRLRNVYTSVVTAALMAGAIAAVGCGVAFNTLPTVALSPATLSWHKVDVGNTSGAKIVTVTNTSPRGALPLKISSINLSANFIQTATTCPTASPLAPGVSCTISVVFRPQTSGALTGALSLKDNATDTPKSVSLSADGGVGFLLFSPTSLSFPSVAPNTVSQPQTAKLTNEGSTPVTINKFAASARFAEGNNCPIYPYTLAPGGSCSVTVTSNPTAAGSISGAVNVEDNFGNVTQLYLSGSDQGLQDAGTLEFSPTTLLWGKVPVGGTSAAKTITVSNLGSSSVSFSNIATGPDFTITASTCAATLGAGASCTLSLAFRPTTATSLTELLTFTDNASGSPQGVSLKGTGSLGDMLFAPTSLSFAGVDPGQASPAQAATLTNETSSSISLATISLSGHFAQTNNCPATLAPQASCTFQVTANPVADGAITGAVNVKDSSGNSSQLYLKGQGGGTNQILSFSPNPVAWGTIVVGQTSGSKTLTVNNGQTVPLTIYSISTGQDFFEAQSNCPTAPATVPAGSSCTISLAFRPYSAGAKSEVITFTDDAPGGNQSVSLTGTGAAGSLMFNPTSLSFAGIDPNTVSQPQTATLTNVQSTAVTLASITLSGHFAQTNNCSGSLAPQASCTFTLTSNPVIDGPIQGSVNVKDGSGTTTQLYLSGMGGVPINSSSGASSSIVFSPTSLMLGKVMLGQTSSASAVTLSNLSKNPVALSTLVAGQDIYVTASTCPVAPHTLAGGAACTISVAFRPQTSGTKSESVSFTDSSSRAQHTLAVTAIGTQGSLNFKPAFLRFRSDSLGSAGAPQSAVLTNELSTPLTLLNIQSTGPFAQTNDCPKKLAPGASCTVELFADFQVVGYLTGTVDATDSTGSVSQLYISLRNETGSRTRTIAPSTLPAAQPALVRAIRQTR